jgi:dTDP-4-dehydrorhamnose reductase
MPDHVQCITLELQSRPSIETALRLVQPDVVLHAAAMTSVADCENKPESARETNVDGLESLLMMADTMGNPPHIVHLSTDLVYDGTLGQPYREEDPTSPLSVYGKTKVQAEHLLNGPAYPGLATIIRTALILTPPNGFRPGVLDWTLETLETGEGFFFEDEFRTPVFVQDLCKVLEQVIEQGVGGLFHVGGQDRVSRLQLAEAAAKAFQVASPKIRSARRDAPELQDLVKLRPADVSLNSSRAVAILNHAPTPLDEGLRAMARLQGV